MQAASESAAPRDNSHGTVPRLFKKNVAEYAPVTLRSTVLFRFGEQCNYRCPMCSNTGETALFFHSTEELLRRAAFLNSCGFRRAVVTGGEATIHPGFWTVVEQLDSYGMTWDINTHGRTFSRPLFAKRAAERGLQRAIISLHSFDPATSAAIFGVGQDAHHGTVAGVDALLCAGVDVMLNCVITQLNLPQLEDYVEEGRRLFRDRVAFKFVFPSTLGKGGRWPGIETLRYGDVRGKVHQLRAIAARHYLRMYFESFPNCVLDAPEATNFGRSTFGESHYLDDASGDRVYAMRHIEAELSAFGEACRNCTALRRCPGVSQAYIKRYGVEELTPFRS